MEKENEIERKIAAPKKAPKKDREENELSNQAN